MQARNLKSAAAARRGRSCSGSQEQTYLTSSNALMPATHGRTSAPVPPDALSPGPARPHVQMASPCPRWPRP